MRKADNLTTICAVVMKFGNLNFLETSGSLQPCKGTDLPFYTELPSVSLVAGLLEDKVNTSLIYMVSQATFRYEILLFYL